MLKGITSKPAPESVVAPDQSAFLHFVTTDGREFGFPFAQLLYFVLEPGGSTDAPQRLILAFPSHDVTVTGFRFHFLCGWIDQQRGFHLTVEDSRFANLRTDQPFVAAIAVASTPHAESF